MNFSLPPSAVDLFITNNICVTTGVKNHEEDKARKAVKEKLGCLVMSFMASIFPLNPPPLQKVTTSQSRNGKGLSVTASFYVTVTDVLSVTTVTEAIR